MSQSNAGTRTTHFGKMHVKMLTLKLSFLLSSQIYLCLQYFVYLLPLLFKKNDLKKNKIRLVAFYMLIYEIFAWLFQWPFFSRSNIYLLYLVITLLWHKYAFDRDFLISFICHSSHYPTQSFQFFLSLSISKICGFCS